MKTVAMLLALAAPSIQATSAPRGGSIGGGNGGLVCPYSLPTNNYVGGYCLNGDIYHCTTPGSSPTHMERSCNNQGCLVNAPGIRDQCRNYQQPNPPSYYSNCYSCTSSGFVWQFAGFGPAMCMASDASCDIQKDLVQYGGSGGGLTICATQTNQCHSDGGGNGGLVCPYSLPTNNYVGGYCLNGDIYHCTAPGSSPTHMERSCDNQGCLVNAPGIRDQCRSDGGGNGGLVCPYSPSNNYVGGYCLNGDIYHCTAPGSSPTHMERSCNNQGCLVNPPGVRDQCRNYQPNPPSYYGNCYSCTSSGFVWQFAGSGPAMCTASDASCDIQKDLVQYGGSGGGLTICATQANACDSNTGTHMVGYKGTCDPREVFSVCKQGCQCHDWGYPSYTATCEGHCSY